MGGMERVVGAAVCRSSPGASLGGPALPHRSSPPPLPPPPSFDRGPAGRSSAATQHAPCPSQFVGPFRETPWPAERCIMCSERLLRLCVFGNQYSFILWTSPIFSPDNITPSLPSPQRHPSLLPIPQPQFLLRHPSPHHPDLPFQNPLLPTQHISVPL